MKIEKQNHYNELLLKRLKFFELKIIKMNKHHILKKQIFIYQMQKFSYIKNIISSKSNDLKFI